VTNQKNLQVILYTGYIFATKAYIGNRKNIKQQYLIHMSPQYGELRLTNG